MPVFIQSGYIELWNTALQMCEDILPVLRFLTVDITGNVQIIIVLSILDIADRY